jgi:hypothetical protein
MSERRKQPPSEATKAAKGDSWKQELERISALSDEQLDDEMRAAGIDPEGADNVAQDVIEKAAREVGLDPRARRRRKASHWIALVAVVVAALAVLVFLRAVARR